MRNLKPLIAALAACMFVYGLAGAADQKIDPKADASIPFADHGAISNWQVENDHSLLIETLGRNWYRATLMGSCFNLRFATRIGFVTNPGGSFDRFSEIRLHDRTCPLVSLVAVPPPVNTHAPKVTAPAPAASPAGSGAQRNSSAPELSLAPSQRASAAG